MKELLVLREVFDIKSDKLIPVVRPTQSEREIFYHRKKIVNICESSASIDDMNLLNSLLDSFEDGYNHLETIEGKTYEVFYSGTFLIRQRVFIPQN